MILPSWTVPSCAMGTTAPSSTMGSTAAKYPLWLSLVMFSSPRRMAARMSPLLP